MADEKKQDRQPEEEKVELNDLEADSPVAGGSAPGGLKSKLIETFDPITADNKTAAADVE